ncbi:hypothetical protein HY637_02455 [Candidatus Woesearchaeota archaeon]|nr:hypothetical protein [Candidatus Woesearchaeota archaeon]
MDKKVTYRLTGFVVLVLGILFFLRDIDEQNLNFIGKTSGWTIAIVLIGAGLLAGEVSLPATSSKTGKSK